MKKNILILALLTAVCLTTRASVVDLGTAAGYSVLTYNSSNISDSSYNGGPIAVVNGDWNQSGGAQTNQQAPENLYLSPGFSNNGPAVLTTVYDANRVNTAWNDATNASAALAALTPTQVFGSITTGLTISESAVGKYVFEIGSINLNQSAITLSAPAGSTFILNVAGNITLAGGASGGGFLLAGGLKSSDVFYNLTGATSTVQTSGGGNAQQFYGTLIATGLDASVNLHPGEVNGEIIARTLTSSSGSVGVVPEVGTGILSWVVCGLVVTLETIRRKRILAA